MRKTSYVIAFLCVGLTLLLNIVSVLNTNWLVVKNNITVTKWTVRYGLTKLCTDTVTTFPIGEGRKVRSESHECRVFPSHEHQECNDKNATFCAAWTTAGYVSELAVGFAVVAMLAIVFGLTAHSRRKRIWKAVAWLVAFHAFFQMVTFAIVTHLYNNESYNMFDNARPSTGYVLNGVSWILAVLVTFGVVLTGVSAKAGHRWAAGNRQATYGSINH